MPSSSYVSGAVISVTEYFRTSLGDKIEKPIPPISLRFSGAILFTPYLPTIISEQY